MLVDNVFLEPDVSKSYKGIRTYNVIRSLEPLGWYPYSSSARRTTKGDPLESFHVVRMRNDNMKIDDDFIELVLSNSHKKDASFTVDIGIYRLVCANGLVIGNSILEKLIIPHKGFITTIIPDIIDIYLSKALQNVENSIFTMKHIKPDQKKIEEFTFNSFYLKHKKEYSPENIEQLYMPKRVADNDGSAWSIYNVVQEKLIAGEYNIIGSDKKTRKARKTNSAKEELELNKNLFNLAQKVLV